MPEYADEDEDWNKLFAEGGGTSMGPNIPKDLSGKDAIKPVDEAEDFEDIDELADEEDLPLEEAPKKELHDGDGMGDDLGDVLREGLVSDEIPDEEWTQAFSGDGHINAYYDQEMDDMIPEEGHMARGGDEHEGMDMDEVPGGAAGLDDQVLADIQDLDPAATDEQLLKIYYPDFHRGTILKMNTLFGPKPSKLTLPKPKQPRQCAPTRAALEVEPDQRGLFRSTIEKNPTTVANIIRVSERSLKSLYNRRLSASSDDEDNDSEVEAYNDDLRLASVEWVIESDDSGDEEMNGTTTKVTSIPCDVYDDLDADHFEINEDDARAHKKVKLDLNDPKLLFVPETPGQRRTGKQVARLPPSNERALMQRYNISNDRAYDMLKENYQSNVRSTIGNMHIDHSMVALRLQSPHYKVKLSKTQMRSHHRPTFNVKPNTVIQFHKPKQRKKKKDKGKHITQLLAKTTDLTLGDSAPFFMLEYSEEFPLVLSNFGMGSKLINYYRKRTPEDTSRPKLPVGETHVLSVQDRSPLWNFGFVEQGKVLPVLYNRMIRAPIFNHEPKQTDFLLVRTTGGGTGQRYYLRTIPFEFAVGQTLPATAIPGPHSRKVTTASKNRLKMIVYRVLNQNERHRLLVKDISAHFPDQNDMQNRQRLKEFMEYQRAGEDQGYWKVKASEPLPNEESIRAMISPEDIALLEAMQVGQQHLEDAGYGKTVDDDHDDQDGSSIEEQLAPWNITRNFINATQNKAMLQLHGEGDPTGRGEAFSFLRTSMKGGFRAMGESVNEKLNKSKYGGHSYNVAVQQKAYNDEIQRIWYAQKKSLQITNEEDLDFDENENDRDNKVSQRDDTPDNHAGDDDVSLFSHNSANPQSNKALRITRFIKDENGTRQRKVEVVTDPNVIRAYVRRRQVIEDAQLAPEEIAPTNDEDRNKRQLKILESELARLQRNQDRRIARNAQKANSGDGKGSKAVKGKSTTRKCATCGAIGHIRTNKSCPLYNERYGSGGEVTPDKGPQMSPPAL
uniref:ARAD1C19426p n=1 Tax=Blastobotrys adeninivorans TaxID=409370 RepID=A0A060T0Y2_BLAAD